jgi:hypothetical protein
MFYLIVRIPIHHIYMVKSFDSREARRAAFALCVYEDYEDRIYCSFKDSELELDIYLEKLESLKYTNLKYLPWDFEVYSKFAGVQ